MFRQTDRSRAHTTILSYENFSRRPELYKFNHIEEDISKYEVSGIIYLRRQEDWIASLFSQTVRGKERRAGSFSEFANRLKPELAFSSVLDSLRRHIPMRTLIAANYHEACTHGLVEDFAARVGLPRELVPDEDIDERNKSPPHWVVLFLLHCNRGGLSDDAFLKVRTALTNPATGSRGPSLREGLDLASPAERAGVREVADADAPRLRDLYGIAFEPRASQAAAYRPFDAEDFAQIREAVAPRLSSATREALLAVERPAG